jgi:hypothetical protein
MAVGATYKSMPILLRAAERTRRVRRHIPTI